MRYTAKDFTLEEKLKLLSGKDNWHTEDLGGRLYEVSVSDGPVGLRKVVHTQENGWQEVPAVAYPSCEVLSQTWNPALAYQMGECLADDCIEEKVDILLAPGVNIKRSPLCGRNFEYISEDPYVAGVFGREYIAGVQSQHVGTCLKHYCANNSEFGRLWTSSDVDERTLREIYLEPFRIACQANPTTVMSSYNLVNGQRMSEHKKLYDLLRKEFWREDGVIISDWGAVQNEAASVRAGLDLKMPYQEGGFKNLKKAYEKGELTDEQIDACIERLLGLIERCEKEIPLRKTKSTKEERREVVQRIAEEGIVLLKNEKGVLPLQENANLLITGLNAAAYYSGRGSSYIKEHAPILNLEEALQKAMPKANIQLKSGGHWDSNYYAAFEDGYDKDAVIVVCGDFEQEEADRQTMKLPRDEEMLILETAERNPNTVVVLRYGAAVDTSAWLDKVAAVVWAGYGGERGNEGLANVLSGKVNPNGKLTETFARCYEDYPVASAQRTHAVNAYSEGLAVGYRYFDRHPEKVVFPFGYGLSYSTFEYSDLEIEGKDGEYTLRFTITNTSSIDGAEIAQVYVREVNSHVVRPVKELKGFAKVQIAAGERAQVEIKLTRREFAYYSIATDCWTVKEGIFEILVGKNAQEICLKKQVTVA